MVRVPLSVRSVAFSLSVLALVCPGQARAESPPGERHDGFYLRFAGGPGWIDVERRTEHAGGSPTLAYSGDSSSVSGWAPFGEVSVGGTPSEHVAIAGTLLGWLMPASELVVGGGPRFGLAGPLAVFLLAPTVDVFPNPLGGLHFGGGAGIAGATVRIDDPFFRTIGGTGAGVTVQAGYDFWTSDEWSVGILGRGTFAVIGSKQETSSVTGHERDTVSSFAFTATLLYH